MKTLVAALLAFVLGVAEARADALDSCLHGRTGQARLEACGKALAATDLNADDRARAHRARGLLRIEAGAVADAVQDFTAALQLAPTDTTSLSGRARAHMVRGDVLAAIADYDTAIRLSPNTLQLHLGRGHAYYVKGDAKSAIADFTRALEIAPNSANAFNRRGLAYRRSGDNARAIADYTSAINLNPVYALAYNNRGYAYEALGRKAEAAADFRAALLLDASLVGARNGLARLGAGSKTIAETEARIREGKRLVESRCSGCHAVGAQGESPNAKAPAFRTLSARHSGLSLREPLSRGIAAPHDQMPKFALTPEQVDSVIAYINNLSMAKPATAKGAWKTRIEVERSRRAADDGLEIGDRVLGLAYARRACASCHNVLGTDARSPNAKAPSFKAIAQTPGMTVTALTVWSRTTHATMPNLVIAPDDMDNLIAYILSLKSPQ